MRRARARRGGEGGPRQLAPHLVDLGRKKVRHLGLLLRLLRPARLLQVAVALAQPLLAREHAAARGERGGGRGLRRGGRRVPEEGRVERASGRGVLLRAARRGGGSKGQEGVSAGHLGLPHDQNNSKQTGLAKPI